jgi:hypothetical protein
VHLLSKAVPIIGIQANIVQVSDVRGLHFTKIIDSYEEPEEETELSGGVYGRDYWSGLAKWTLDAADAMQTVLQPFLPGSTLNFLKNYIAISVGGTNLFWLYKRKGGKSLLNFKMSQSFHEQAAGILNGRQIPYVMKPDGFRRIPVHAQMITENKDLFAALAQLVKTDWSEE